MQHLKKVILVLVLSVGQYGASAFDLTNINFNSHYAFNADFTIEYRVVSNGDLWNIYTEIDADSVSAWSKVLLLQNSYDAIDHDTLSTFQVDTFLVEKNKEILMFSFPKKSLGKVLILSFNKPSIQETRIFDISLNPNAAYSDFCPFDSNGIPIVKSYVRAQSVPLEAGVNWHVYSYRNSFGPADPPMGAVKPLAPTLTIENSFYVRDSLNFSEPGMFYLIQKDTNDVGGITLLDVPYYLPNSRQLDELVPPLTYITTAAEFENITKGGDKKQKFESFWINTFGTRFRAKRAIKNYYDRIERANVLFTTYKLGWQSDRGIIYIIYGEPDVVLKTERTEIWKYPDVQYEFVKISTLFAPATYSVKRDKKFEKGWYRQVGSLREGDG